MKPFPLTVFAFPLLASPLVGIEAPTNLRAAKPLVSGTSFELAWEDNSLGEDGFEFQAKAAADEEWTTITTSVPNQTLYSRLTGGFLNSAFQFRVRAKSESEGDSEWSNVAESTLGASVPIWMASRNFHGAVSGTPVTVPAPLTFGDPPTSFSALDLPDGLSIDADTGVVSGTAPAPGFYRPIIIATEGTETCSTFLTIRVIAPTSGPEVHTTVPDLVTFPDIPLCLELADHLHDPDTPVAVRIFTNLGDIDAIIHQPACPASAVNFLGYVDRGNYEGVAFHRSSTSASSGVEVIQAGHLLPDGPGEFKLNHREPNVPDEAGLSNILGTLAMAKTGANHSGSNQWYFNTIDNTNLDGPQSNGGYTVFGRATTPSLPVLAEIHGRPRGDYSVSVEGIVQTFNDWPTSVAPAGASPALDELIQIQSATRIAPLSFELTSNADPSLASAGLAGSKLTLTPVPGAAGNSTLGLEITDLDGTILPVAIRYCVLDLDLVPFLSPAHHPAATFNHDLTPGLSYELQRSLDGENWVPVWQTSDGFGAAPVIGNLDQGSSRRLTVEDSSLTSPTTRAALVRVVVTKRPL